MTDRDRAMLGAVGALVLLAAAWFLLLAPQRDAASEAAQVRSTAQARLTAAKAAVQASAPTQQTDDVRDQITVARLGKAVPTDVNMPALIVQLQALARTTDVRFQGVTVAGADGAAPAATGGTSTTSAAPAGTTTTAAPAAGASVPSSGATPPGTVIDASGYTTLPLDLKLEGRYLDIERFLAAMDGLVQVRGGVPHVRGRLLTVQGASLTVGDAPPKLDADVTATAYLAPEDVETIKQLAQMPGFAATASETDAGTSSRQAGAAAPSTATEVR